MDKLLLTTEKMQFSDFFFTFLLNTALIGSEALLAV